LKADFDRVWRGYRCSQVQFYMQQTENEVRMLTEDRDAALSQVSDISNELELARSEAEDLRAKLDQMCRQPIDETGLPDRLQRMVRLARDEAEEVISHARASAEHEWARAEEVAAELCARYQRLVDEAEKWREEARHQCNEMLGQTRREIDQMAQEAEEHRRGLDRAAEQRRVQIEEDFEISMAARREEAMRTLAERDRASREEAQRRIQRADEYVEAMRRLRQDAAERVRAAQRVLAEAEPLLSASATGNDNDDAEAYVAATVHDGPESAPHEVTVPQQRAAQRQAETAPAS
jgi:hypothetical protein